MSVGPVIAIGGIATVAIGVMALSSAYIVNEGNVGVITRMGQAQYQEGPTGLQFKTPFIEGVREFDVRERAFTLTMDAATFDQLPTTMEVSVNWQPNSDAIMDIFVKYGGPEQFAANTVAPRLRQALKSTVGRFSGADLTRKREEVAAAMLADTQKALVAYPATFSSVQLENFSLPQRYMEAVLVKQEQAEATERERLRLEQQNLQAQQAVNTARAEKEATIARAEGQAFATKAQAEADAEAVRLLAEAEAEGIEQKANAIAANPLVIEFERAQRWNGAMPTTIMGEMDSDILWSMK